MNFGTVITKELTRDSIFIIGKVLSVEGRSVNIKVNKNKNLSHILYNGTVVKNVSVGSYVKITKGFVEIIGKVEGEFITEEKIYNQSYKKEEVKINRILKVSLFGHFDGSGFRQGIKEMPLIDNECYLLDKEEFNRLHRFHLGSEQVIDIGSLTEEPSQSIQLSVNKLFASHIGVFGNTGSGKSNTLAKLYTELFRLNRSKEGFVRNAKFFVIDFNGEYTGDKVITSRKRVFKLSTSSVGDRYPISNRSIQKLEIISVLLEATEKTQKPFISRSLNNDWYDEDFQVRARESIKNLCINFLLKADPSLGLGIFVELMQHLKKVVSPQAPIDDLLTKIDKGELKWHSKNNCYYIKLTSGDIYSNADANSIFSNFFEDDINRISFKEDLLVKMQFKIIQRYFHEVLHGYSNQEHIKPLIGRMFKKFDILNKVVEIVGDERIFGDEKTNLDIISLKDVNLEMKKTLPLIIAKQLYDSKKERLTNEGSLHLIIDEAHNILSVDSERESESWKDYRLETFEEIIKEGRKFGVFLLIASQRPYDISPTIISQLHNYFIHRLINNNDILAVEKAVAYLDKLSFQTLPILSAGSCFVAGSVSDIPIKVSIDILPSNMQPNSGTINLQNSWESKPKQLKIPSINPRIS